jgi:hypothetical protein
MSWIWLLMSFLNVCAGIGLKWAVDQVWPPPPRITGTGAQPQPHEPGPQEAGEDMMDVLASGYEAGYKAAQAGRHARPASILEQLGVPTGIALPGGGWDAGPMYDVPPTGWLASCQPELS